MRQSLVLAVLVLWPAAGRIAGSAEQAPPGEVRWGNVPHTDTVFKPMAYASLAEWNQRRQWLRDQVRFAAGLYPEPEKTPLNARIFGKLERDGYTVEKVCFESRPGFFVTGNLYRPATVKGKVPAVACPHGHWAHGRIHHEELGSIPARCITLARLGATVFTYDMVGYNDSKRQIDHTDAQVNSPPSALWGISSLALQTFNSIRVLDFLQSLPEVDPQRIGVTGASGGGTQTFILSAVDDRVTVAAPVNMISSTMQGGCICENAPLLRIETNNMDIGALFAPKPLLLVSATGDWTKNTPTVEYPMIRSVYELYGTADRVANVHVDAAHNYNLASRQAMYRFFGKWLLNRNDADSLTEGDIQVEKPEDLLVFSDDNLPAGMLTVDQLIKQEKAAVCRRINSLTLKPKNRKKLDELTRLVRFGLEHAICSSFPREEDVRILVSEEGKPPWVQYERNHRAVRARILEATKGFARSDVLTLCFHPAGFGAATEMQVLANGLAAQQQDLQIVEVFGTGDNVAPAGGDKPRGSTKFFTTFNRTDTAEAVYDILTILAGSCRNQEVVTPEGSARRPPKRINVIGLGRMGPICLVARALVPDELARAVEFRTVIDMNSFDTLSDEVYVKDLFLPNIQRIGGLRAIAATAANGPIWLHNTGDKFGANWTKEAGKINGVEVRVDKTPADLNAIADWLTPAR